MNDRTHGYIQQPNSTHGYHQELGPVLMSLAILNKGHRSDVMGEGAAYCERGRGYGPLGQKLLRDGIFLETPEDNLTKLSLRAEAFASGRPALCRQLKVSL